MMFDAALAAIACLAVVTPLQGPVQPRLVLKPASVKAPISTRVKATVVVTFAPGLHAYQNPPTLEHQIPVKLEAEDKALSLKVSYPKGALKTFMGEEAAVYEGTIRLPIEFTMPKKPGKFELKLKLSYQQCNDEACFPPATVVAKGTLEAVKPAKAKG
jgi:hypothetical protein